MIKLDKNFLKIKQSEADEAYEQLANKFGQKKVDNFCYAVQKMMESSISARPKK